MRCTVRENDLGGSDIAIKLEKGESLAPARAFAYQGGTHLAYSYLCTLLEEAPHTLLRLTAVAPNTDPEHFYTWDVENRGHYGDQGAMMRFAPKGTIDVLLGPDAMALVNDGGAYVATLGKSTLSVEPPERTSEWPIAA